MNIDDYRKQYGSIVSKYFEDAETEIQQKDVFGSLTCYEIAEDLVFEVGGEVVLVIDAVYGKKYAPTDYFKWIDNELSQVEVVI